MIIPNVPGRLPRLNTACGGRLARKAAAGRASRCDAGRLAPFQGPPAARDTGARGREGGAVGAIGVILAARSRRHRQSWLLLVLLVAIGAGVVLAAVTAGRRADSAFPRFVAAHGYDAIVYSGQPLPLEQLPEVKHAVETRAPFYGHPWCSCGKTINEGNLAVREVPAADLSRVVKLVSGRMPDQSNPHEMLASFTLQRDYGIGPGTVIRLPMAGASQWEAILKAMNGGPVPEPSGPVVALRVVGIAAATRGTPALPFYYVQLRHGQADFARFEAAVSGRYGAGVQDLDRAAAAITASIHPQAIGWWTLAALGALAV